MLCQQLWFLGLSDTCIQYPNQGDSELDRSVKFSGSDVKLESKMRVLLIENSCRRTSNETTTFLSFMASASPPTIFQLAGQSNSGDNRLPARCCFLNGSKIMTLVGRLVQELCALSRGEIGFL